MNRLKDATSPYLLQHADNPVDWWPWCDEAFEKAIAEDKPIFLSIGYATCHWCHVMAHESFENEACAEQMNRDFINIKLDREERPDLDAIYMAALQATQGQGGWPMSVFLDHQKRPFFLATYLPPEQKFNRPSFSMVMTKMRELWDQERETIFKNSEGLLEHLKLAESASSTQLAIPDESIFNRAFSAFQARFDKTHGGLGGKPKFPTSHVYDAILRIARRGIGTEEGLAFTDFTLNKLFAGGIHDHVGGGYHRYSTDERWLLPHFEKMLYDQALLLGTCVQAYQLIRSDQLAEQCHDILRYLKSDLRNPQGGFFSGEDADSEGEEGKFYVFTKDELIEILGQEDGNEMISAFGVQDTGNFHDEATGQLNGTNILHTPSPLTIEEYQSRFTPLLAKLHAYRENRIRPSLDDKVVASWNGLALSSLAQAARTFHGTDHSYHAEALKCADFLLNEMRDDDENFYRSWRQDQLGHRAFLEDFAAIGLGLFELFQITGEVRYLDASVDCAEAMLEDFMDDQGGFFQTRSDQSDAILRQKESYDGAEPSGNAVAAELLLRLGHLLQRSDFWKGAEGALAALGASATSSPSGHARYLCALDFYHSKRREIVVCVADAEGEASALKEIGPRYLPNTLLVIKRATNADDLAKWLPWCSDMEIPENGFRAFICQDMACSLPVEGVEALKQALS